MSRWLHDCRGVAAALAISVGAHVAVVAALGADPATARPVAAVKSGMLSARLTLSQASSPDAPTPPLDKPQSTAVAAASAPESESVVRQGVALAAPGLLAVAMAGVRYYRGRELDRRAEALNEVEIVYPEAAARARMQGTMRLDLYISEDGRFDKAVILAADPPEMFDEAVLEAVRALRFSPGVLAGQAVKSVKTIEIPLNVGFDSATLQSAQAPVFQISVEQK